MWLELCELTDRLSHDPAVRAIIFSGAGDRAFTAGLDVNAASSSTDGGLISSVQDSSIDSARKAVHLRRKVVSFQDCVSALERCEKPVIAAMHGITFGLGIDLSVATDIRLCAQGTKFSVKEVDIGIAADIGTLTRLPKVVGHYGWVKEVCLTGRIFGPEEALRVGFVNAVYDDKAKMIAAAVEMAALIASKSPVAVQGTKELLNYSRDHAVEDGMFDSSQPLTKSSDLKLTIYQQVSSIRLSGALR
jgi:delta(3,5)-delta(2,4)-dienoyl-CoA isomerase